MKLLPLRLHHLAFAALLLHGFTTHALESRDSPWDEAGNLWDEATHWTLHDLESDFEKAKTWFESEIASHVAEGLADIKPIPGVLAQVSWGYSETPPIRSTLKTSKVQSELTAALYDPSGDYPQPKAFDFAEGRYNGWDDGWFGVALDSFDAMIELDIDLSASASTGDLTLSLLKKSAAWDGVGVEVEFQLYLTADAAASMSFTTGLNLSLANPSAIMMPALNDSIIDLKSSVNIGFSSDNFILTPIFNASMPQLDFSATLALRTVFSVTVEDIDVGSLTLDLPAFDLGVKTLQNKLSNCKTPPPGTPQDQIYAELVHMTASLDAVLSYELLEDEFSGVIGSWTMFDMLDECYAFFPGSGFIGHVPASSKDSALTAAAVTTCTTNGKTTTGIAVKALSPGEKAAIAIGTLLGVSTIATLAWYAGRASQRQSMTTLDTDEAESNPRTRFHNLFDLSRWRRSHALVFASDKSMRHIDTESGSFLSHPDSELQAQQWNDPQTQERHSIKRKPVRSAAPDQESGSSWADIPLGTEYDVFRTGMR